MYSIDLIVAIRTLHCCRPAKCDSPDSPDYMHLVREAAKKSSFLSGPATKAFTPSPSA